MRNVTEIFLVLFLCGSAVAQDTNSIPYEILTGCWGGYDAACVQAVTYNMLHPGSMGNPTEFVGCDGVSKPVPSDIRFCPLCCVGGVVFESKTNSWYTLLGVRQAYAGQDDSAPPPSPIDGTGLSSLTYTSVPGEACIVIPAGTNPVTITKFLGLTNFPNSVAENFAQLQHFRSVSESNFMSAVPTGGEDAVYFGAGSDTNYGYATALSMWSNTFVYPFLGSNPDGSTNSSIVDAGRYWNSNAVGALPRTAPAFGHQGASGYWDVVSILVSNSAFEDGNSIIVDGTSDVRDPNLVVDFEGFIDQFATNGLWAYLTTAQKLKAGHVWKFNMDPFQFKPFRFVVNILFVVCAAWIFHWGLGEKWKEIGKWLMIEAGFKTAANTSDGLSMDLVKDGITAAKMTARALMSGVSGMVTFFTVVSFISIITDGYSVFKDFIPMFHAGSNVVRANLGGSRFSHMPAGSSIWESVIEFIALSFPIATAISTLLEIWLLRVTLAAKTTGMFANVRRYFLGA